MASASLTTQMVTIAMLTLQRQLVHDSLVSRTTWNNQYDYIVVGAGGAGAIVASRLSEEPQKSVLLLEAGHGGSTLIDIPANYYEFVLNPQWDWRLPMVSQPNLGQAYTMPVRMSIGKTMGGSTAISGMVYNRGNRRHFDEWESRFGCKGWNYKNVLKYFRKMENQTDPEYLRNGYHSVGGPVTVISDWKPMERGELPAFQDYIRTANEAGYPTIDPNGPTQNGVIQFQHTIRNGLKVTSSSAYLEPAVNRSNLNILARSQVTRINFDGNRAVSVTFRRDGNDYTVRANKEIILSAGAIHSTQLLLLSGVGPREQLQRFNIPVISDRPVGKNLHDHTNTILYFDVLNERDSYQSVDLNVQNIYKDYVDHRGALSMFPNSGTYISTSLNDNPEWPDIMTEMVRSNNHWNNITNIATLYRTNQNEWTKYWAPYSGRHLMSFDVQHVQPRARGSVQLNSADPFDDPIIDPNYFGDELDLEAMVEGIEIVLNKLTARLPFSGTTRFIDRQVPGCIKCHGPNPLCREYLRCFVKQTSVPVYRQVGTCRCGQANDPQAVVDEHLRVIGTQGLRVIDGGIMPRVINANTWIATAMIAEYGAEMIKQSNK